jgi:hypothetical protein
MKYDEPPPRGLFEALRGRDCVSSLVSETVAGAPSGATKFITIFMRRLPKDTCFSPDIFSYYFHSLLPLWVGGNL